MLNPELSTHFGGIKIKYNNFMLLIILILIFIRPFICALAFPYSNFFYSLTLLIFLGAYLIYKKPLFTKKSGLVYPFVFFYLALSLSLFFSQDRFNSLAQLYQYLSGLGLLWVASSLPAEDRLNTIKLILLAGLIISALAIYQYLFGFKHVLDYLSPNQTSWPFLLSYLQRKRAFFPFVTPGALGGYLAMVMFLSLSSKNRIWFILPVFVALLLTKSVSAFACLLGGLVVYFAVQHKLKRINILLLGGLFLLVLIMIIGRSATEQGYLQPGFSALMRLNYWQETLMIIRDHPLVGIGLGNFNLANSRYAHNSYLQVWAEMGILGLVSLIWIIWAVMRAGLKKLTQTPGQKQAACLLAASAVFLMHNAIDFTFFLPEVSLIWWVILGLTVTQE